MAPAQTTFLLQKIQTALLTLCTALVIGCFSQLWKMNAQISAMQTMIENSKENISRLDDRVDFLDKTSADHAARITKLELFKH